MNIHPLWYLCLILRLTLIFVLIYISKHIDDNAWVKILSLIVLSIMGCGFIFKYFTGSNDEIQIAKVFWHDSRLLHGVLYLIAVYFFFVKNVNMMTTTLLIDLIGSIIYRLLSQQ